MSDQFGFCYNFLSDRQLILKGLWRITSELSIYSNRIREVEQQKILPLLAFRSCLLKIYCTKHRLYLIFGKPPTACKDQVASYLVGVFLLEIILQIAYWPVMDWRSGSVVECLPAVWDPGLSCSIWQAFIF